MTFFLSHDKKIPPQVNKPKWSILLEQMLWQMHTQKLFFMLTNIYVTKYTWKIEFAFTVVINDKEAEWKNQVKEELKYGVTKANNLPSTLIIFKR